MRKIATDLLEKHGSYIDALQEAIDQWRKATSMKDKRDYMLAIGELGKEIHHQNKTLDIAHMDVEE